MAEKKSPSKFPQLSRRDVLSSLAVGVGFLASVTLLGRLLSKGRRADPRGAPLPEEGSIFQPRRDARLEEWERTHRQ